MIILDTNVVSEFMRPEPDSDVTSWLDDIPRGEIWTTAITVAEISAGVALLPPGGRSTALQDSFDRALAGFEDRILAFTATNALAYGTVVAARTRVGRPISIADAQIAAIANNTGATLATRNVKDFEGTGIHLLNPWGSAPASTPL